MVNDRLTGRAMVNGVAIACKLLFLINKNPSFADLFRESIGHPLSLGVRGDGRRPLLDCRNKSGDDGNMLRAHRPPGPRQALLS
jgi:hypothetical protein